MPKDVLGLPTLEYSLLAQYTMVEKTLSFFIIMSTDMPTDSCSTPRLMQGLLNQMDRTLWALAKFESS